MYMHMIVVTAQYFMRLFRRVTSIADAELRTYSYLTPMASETAYIGDTYGGDEATSAMSEPLSWRQNPEDSLSDWKIVINGVETYCVHRSMLGAGQRASQYFMRLFRGAIGASTSEAESCTSRLQLEASSAEAFPIFLCMAWMALLRRRSSWRQQTPARHSSI